jgi:Protein of unknown function (DUF3572)
MKSGSRLVKESAEMLAIQALAFIGEEPERLAGLLHASGLEIEQIRGAAREPRFLVGVLEHMLADESLLLAFATSAGVDPAAIGQARNALAGGGTRGLP